MKPKSVDLEVPKNYAQSVGVCKNMDAVIASDTFRYLLIKALRASDVSNEKIGQMVSLVQKTTKSKKPTDEELTMLRLELLKPKKILQKAQREFNGLKFSNMDLAKRKQFEALFGENFGTKVVAKIRNEILQKVYFLMSMEALKKIPEFEVADEASEEARVGVLFIAKKYGLEVNNVTRMSVRPQTAGRGKGRNFIQWEAIQNGMRIGVGEDGKTLHPIPVD